MEALLWGAAIVIVARRAKIAMVFNIVMKKRFRF
jgi:hypothetical protein